MRTFHFMICTKMRYSLEDLYQNTSCFSGLRQINVSASISRTTYHRCCRTVQEWKPVLDASRRVCNKRLMLNVQLRLFFESIDSD